MGCCHCSGDKQHVLLIYVMCKKMLLLDFPEKSRYNSFINADDGLINKVAMDIKACPSNYHVLTGVNVNLDAIRETAGWLCSGDLDYEFRTTVVRELHSENDFLEISQWLRGAKAYYLQAYRDSEGVLMPGFSSCSEEEMKNYRDILSRTIPVVEIRGMDL